MNQEHLLNVSLRVPALSLTQFKPEIAAVLTQDEFMRRMGELSGAHRAIHEPYRIIQYIIFGLSSIGYLTLASIQIFGNPEQKKVTYGVLVLFALIHSMVYHLFWYLGLRSVYNGQNINVRPLIDQYNTKDKGTLVWSIPFPASLVSNCKIMVKNI